MSSNKAQSIENRTENNSFRHDDPPCPSTFRVIQLQSLARLPSRSGCQRLSPSAWRPTLRLDRPASRSTGGLVARICTSKPRFRTVKCPFRVMKSKIRVMKGPFRPVKCPFWTMKSPVRPVKSPFNKINIPILQIIYIDYDVRNRLRVKSLRPAKSSPIR
jgi:hypothetical protein